MFSPVPILVMFSLFPYFPDLDVAGDCGFPFHPYPFSRGDVKLGSTLFLGHCKVRRIGGKTSGVARLKSVGSPELLVFLSVLTASEGLCQSVIFFRITPPSPLPFFSKMDCAVLKLKMRPFLSVLVPGFYGFQID